MRCLMLIDCVFFIFLNVSQICLTIKVCAGYARCVHTMDMKCVRLFLPLAHTLCAGCVRGVCESVCEVCTWCVG